MLWDYRLSHQALKNIKKFPGKERGKVFAVLEGIKVNPFSGDIRLMQGKENLYRRRTGNYRIYFRPDIARHILDIPLIERKQSH